MTCDGESEARTTLPSLPGTVDLEEPLEDPGLVRLRDADALVGHGQHDLVSLLGGSHGHHPTGARELDRVVQEVQQQLPQSLGIAPHGGQRILRQCQPEFDTLAVRERPEPSRPRGQEWSHRNVIEMQLRGSLLDP